MVTSNHQVHNCFLNNYIIQGNFRTACKKEKVKLFPCMPSRYIWGEEILVQLRSFIMLPLLRIAQGYLAHPALILVTVLNMPFQLLITVKTLHSANQFIYIALPPFALGPSVLGFGAATQQNSLNK
jgi:hypothetical protein